MPFDERRLHPIDGRTVDQLIRFQKLKKWWVAETIGVHRTTLHRWLSGEIHAVRIQHLRRLSQILDTGENVLVNGEGITKLS